MRRGRLAISSVIVVVLLLGSSLSSASADPGDPGLGQGPYRSIALICVAEFPGGCALDTAVGDKVGEALINRGGLSSDHPVFPQNSPYIWLRVQTLYSVPWADGFWALYVTTDQHQRTRVTSFNMPQYWYQGSIGRRSFDTYFGIGQFGFSTEEMFDGPVKIEIALEQDDSQGFVPVYGLNPLFAAGEVSGS
jgi:hypothetical protein